MVLGSQETSKQEEGRPMTPNLQLPEESTGASSPQNQKTIRLFGSHMNSFVTYEDTTTAFVLTDDIFSRMSSTVYERFSGGAHLAGIKVIRGYTEPQSKAEPLKPADSDLAYGSPGKANALKEDEEDEDMRPLRKTNSENARLALERQMSNLITPDPEKQEEEARKLEEEEIQEDYQDPDNLDQDREIEHLLLVTHGIGQRLGLRLEGVNFIHDVNALRRTLKTVYSSSTDLQALNGDLDNATKNCRLQVLPICWRHRLDFPKQSLKHNREEHDLGDVDSDLDDEYPALDDITLDGVPAVRNLITDLAMDVLLYQAPAYKGHISRIVLEECNRIYNLFKQRNPSFKGKVSLVGHSLGSAILFDILCNQGLEPRRASSRSARRPTDTRGLQLDFEVEDFYALGSPLGMFQMLKGRTISARQSLQSKPATTPFGEPEMMFGSSYDQNTMSITTSTPSCRQMFNIFHPADPIAYRIEPLISPAMAALKPQPLPYTKKGIFGAPVGQGLQGIGQRVGQSVSGLWSSLSSGIASNLLNRSLGLSNAEASRLGDPLPDSNHTRDLYNAPSTAAMAAATSAPLTVEDAKRLVAQGAGTLERGEDGTHPPTLLDSGLQTLYMDFQKQHPGSSAEESEEAEKRQILEEQARRLKREEAKVRALNSNGRVDYSIQE
jgi:hypothetical protein